MNSLDFILIAIISFGGYQGYKKGFLMELISLVAFFLAILLGFKCLYWAMNFIEQWLEINPTLLPFIAFLALFIIILFGMRSLGKLTKKVIDTTPLGFLDDIIGALIGVLKWFFALSLLVWIVKIGQISFSSTFFKESLIFPYLEDIAPAVITWVGVHISFFENILYAIQELTHNQN